MSKDMIFKMRIDAVDHARLQDLTKPYCSPVATVVRMLIKEAHDRSVVKAGPARAVRPQSVVVPDDNVFAKVDMSTAELVELDQILNWIDSENERTARTFIGYSTIDERAAYKSLRDKIRALAEPLVAKLDGE